MEHEVAGVVPKVKKVYETYRLDLERWSNEPGVEHVDVQDVSEGELAEGFHMDLWLKRERFGLNLIDAFKLGYRQKYVISGLSQASYLRPPNGDPPLKSKSKFEPVSYEQLREARLLANKETIEEEKGKVKEQAYPNPISDEELDGLKKLLMKSSENIGKDSTFVCGDIKMEIKFVPSNKNTSV